MSLKGTQEGEEYRCSSSHQTAATLYREPQGSFGCEKHRLLSQESWDAYERNDFSMPRLLHPPIHRNVLNSLTWDIWFSLINNNFLIFRLPALLWWNFYITWLLPLLPYSSSLRVTWDAVYWAWSPQNSQRIKYNSQLLGCEYFLSWHWIIQVGSMYWVLTRGKQEDQSQRKEMWPRKPKVEWRVLQMDGGKQPLEAGKDKKMGPLETPKRYTALLMSWFNPRGETDFGRLITRTYDS